MDPASEFLRYTDAIEVKKPGEEETFEKITSVMMHISQVMNDRYRHAVRSVHAKSHGLLKGELRVHDDLPEPYRQGMFDRAATYPAILRFSTNPGDILADSVSAPRGLGIKILGLSGRERVDVHQGNSTQDFVLNNDGVFGAPDADGFLKGLQLLEKHLDDSEAFKKLVSASARGINAMLAALGHESGALRQLGHPATHVLGESYGSLLPIRYGDYIAKVCLIPASENLKKLNHQHVALAGHYSALRDSIVEFFKTETAVWTLGVQLCTDLATMPVEDASVKWPEDKSPYVPVATLTVAAQNAYSPERRVVVDEQMVFDPWHALAAHRPLGNVMRARKKAYHASAEYRLRMNGRHCWEPTDISQLPD